MTNAGMRGRPIAPLVLSAQERSYLERQVRRYRVARSLSERCRVILRCADGLPSKDVAAELGLHEHTVGKWRRRFLKDRCDGLLDEARPGRPRTIDDDQIAAVIEPTLRMTPIDATHWSIRSMAWFILHVFGLYGYGSGGSSKPNSFNNSISSKDVRGLSLR
jgi:transposase